MARRREVRRVPRFEIAEEDVMEEKYEDMLLSVAAYELERERGEFQVV
jgi:hypothetical protein